MKLASSSSLALVSILLSPVMAFAGGAGTVGTPNVTWITAVINAIDTVVTSAIPIFLGIALLIFIWGVVKFMMSDDDNSRSEGKKHMLWGLIGLFVIVSVWGLVILLQVLVGIEGQDAISPPQVPRAGGN